MALKLITVLFILPLLALNANAQQPVTYDVRKYGAKPGADISQALLDAWKEACNSTTPSKIFIPPGTWSLSQVKLLGTNKAPIELQIQGTLQASPDPSKLPNKEGEWITINYVNFLTISGGGVLDGQGQEAWKLNDCHKNKNCAKLPINLSLNFINNSIIQDVTTKDSKNFHVNCISSYNVTFLRFTVSAPGDSPNTDGIHVARSTNVRITDSIIKTGDDCVSMGDETKEVYIQNVTCGPGHGISIGSLGGYATEKDVTGIYVRNCTFIGTTNGVRVKTWPSAPATLTVSDLHFEDLIMDNASLPIVIDQEYCPHNLCNKDRPSSIKISNVSIKNVRGTTSTAEAVWLVCSGLKPCENVEVGDIDLKYTGNQGPITTQCTNVKPKFVGKQNPPVCATTAKSA
ncbi:Polygalacturonase [Sesamum alatum]|uniref:Polygalacturonase n=1 Tax=Sesamum alatum TaxID=300844 RepID=A0AAE2CWU9_9LAMI|nr:Polygalacturonase [Sesamum alatum]